MKKEKVKIEIREDKECPESNYVIKATYNGMSKLDATLILWGARRIAKRMAKNLKNKYDYKPFRERFEI